MILFLTPLPATTAGIYTIGGVAGRMPTRALLLHPAAAEAFTTLERASPLVYSDIFRSADASLVAVATKAGTQPPGYSAHGFGLAVDVAVDATLGRYGWSYSELRSELGRYGWYCHRRDGLRGAEDWHFNYLGPDPSKYIALTSPQEPESWARAVEAKILETYGNGFVLDAKEMQVALTKLRLYKGAIDGIVGPLTDAAVHAFQRAWHLPEGHPDARMLRTLAYVASERLIEPAA